MPSPRAVLADIIDFKLNPKVAHTVTHGSGRLSKVVTQSHDISENNVAVALPNALSKIPEEPVVVEQEKEVLELVENNTLVVTEEVSLLSPTVVDETPLETVVVELEKEVVTTPEEITKKRVKKSVVDKG